MSQLSVSIAKMVLRSGSEIHLPERGITAIVGGNNVGKSSLLSETVAWLGRHRADLQIQKNVLDRAVLRKRATEDDLLAWLRESGFSLPTGNFAWPGSSPGIEESYVRHLWQGDEAVGQLLQFFVHQSEAISRAGYATGTSRRENIEQSPTHPMHYLEDDPELLQELSDTCVRIFRIPLTLDRLSNTVSFRIGKTKVSAPPIDAVTKEYRDSLTSLPLLAEQGDGMRSLLGLLLTVMTSSFPIVLVDEPEAFLHPPQAFELGRILGEIAVRREIQIVIATHDRSLIAGLLEAEQQVSIVRLDRSGNVTKASQLNSVEVKSLWSDSVLRYSNALEGLFHHLVVLAEGDDDCRFYRAALDSLDASSAIEIPPSEVLFVPTGGKDGMAKVAKALTALGVRVVATPDLDILDDASKLKSLVMQFGGRWDEIEQDYNNATRIFRSQYVPARKSDVLKALQAVLSSDPDESFDEAAAREVRAQMRINESPWKALKRYGMAAFSSGESHAAALRLLERLDNMGICLVRQGELERFAPSLAVRKGPAWLPAAIAAGTHESEPAKEHLRRIIQSRA